LLKSSYKINFLLIFCIFINKIYKNTDDEVKFLDSIEQIQLENKKLIDEMTELARTEDLRASVNSAVFIRKNDELRLNHIIDINNDIIQGAKTFGQKPEKYVSSQDSIVKSYVEEINKFTKVYNEEYINIMHKIQMSTEHQKALMFKIQKISNTKQLYEIANKVDDNMFEEFDNNILEYKKQIKLYENVISRCDKEFESCKARRKQDFEELFRTHEVLAIADNKNVFKKIVFKISNKFNGYENFSKYVLKRHANKIDEMKTGKVNKYVNKVKQNMVNFSYEIDNMLENK